MNHSNASQAGFAQRELATFIHGLPFAAIPENFRTRLKQSVLDSIGCGLHGAGTPWAAMVAAHATTQGSGPCRLWSHPGVRVGSSAAVLANATMIHSFELDDIHSGSRSHPGGVTLPVALALAESGRVVPGRALIEALAVGYETLVRVGACQGVSSFNRGWHPTGTAGVFAAAATASRVLGLDPERCVHALGVAGTMPCGLMAAQYGAMVKRLYAGHAAAAGLLGASLAQSGFTGVTDIFEADYGGYPKAVSDVINLAALTEGLAIRFDAASIGYKLFSCVGTNHTALQAIADLMRTNAIGADAVESVEITTSQYQVLHSGWDYVPGTVMAAQMNLQYCTAVLLLEGDVFVDQFRDALLADPAVLALASRVKVITDPVQDHKDRTARVTLLLRGGRRLEGRCAAARGHALNPPEWSDLERKFLALAGGRLSEGVCAELVDMTRRLEDIGDVNSLLRLLDTAIA